MAIPFYGDIHTDPPKTARGADIDKIKVPARIIYQMQNQISALEKVIARKQARLAELKASLARMERDKP